MVSALSLSFTTGCHFGPRKSGSKVHFSLHSLQSPCLVTIAAALAFNTAASKRRHRSTLTLSEDSDSIAVAAIARAKKLHCKIEPQVVPDEDVKPPRELLDNTVHLKNIECGPPAFGTLCALQLTKSLPRSHFRGLARTISLWVHPPTYHIW